jgi:hypothetical protein
MDLRYHTSSSEVDDLEIGRCVVRWCGSGGRRWPMFWMRVLRETDGAPDTFAVPLNPGGPFLEQGPGGRTWGFAKTGDGVWQVSPSINVCVSRVPHPGERPTEASLWHQTPRVVGVPEPPPWSTNPA